MEDKSAVDSDMEKWYYIEENERNDEKKTTWNERQILRNSVTRMISLYKNERKVNERENRRRDDFCPPVTQFS